MKYYYKCQDCDFESDRLEETFVFTYADSRYEYDKKQRKLPKTGSDGTWAYTDVSYYCPNCHNELMMCSE